MIFFFLLLLLLLWVGRYRGKKVFQNQQKPTEGAKSFLSSIHIKQTWVLSLTGPITHHSTLAVPYSRTNSSRE